MYSNIHRCFHGVAVIFLYSHFFQENTTLYANEKTPTVWRVNAHNFTAANISYCYDPGLRGSLYYALACAIVILINQSFIDRLIRIFDSGHSINQLLIDRINQSIINQLNQ